MKWYEWILIYLVVLGAVNWGFTAVGFNLVENIIKSQVWEKIIYVIIGLAGLYSFYTLHRKKR